MDGYKAPVITDANGLQDLNVTVTFDENTAIYSSCTMTFMNEFYVFGGNSAYSGDRRQISKLVGCQLQRIGTLEFDHDRGACANVNDNKIYLCFNNNSLYNDSKRCMIASTPEGQYSEAALTEYEHRQTSIAASSSKK